MKNFFRALFKVKNLTAKPDDFGFNEDSNNYRTVGQLKFVIFALIAVVVWQSVSLSRAGDNKVVNVMIPNTIYAEPRIKVGNGWANDYFFKVWADNIFRETSDFNPSNAKNKLNYLFGMIDPNKSSQYVGELAKMNNLILRNMMSQSFTLKNTTKTFYSDKQFSNETTNDLETVAAVYKYDGVAAQSFNKNPAIDKPCSYTISLTFDKGWLYASSYATTCFDK
ncbi:MAG: TraE/TraK family type IV conjugative transfer system protein [Campylobacterales bacterium]|nr:TraE/TraK family type IV conjugative transfer system protein [Campylobacterales bacterium]